MVLNSIIMALIYLDDIQTRQIFLNKYLKEKEFKEGSKPSPDYNSFEFIKGKSVIPLPDKQVVFLSHFELATIKSEYDKNIFNRNYDIPIGFLATAKTSVDNKIPFETTTPDIQLDYEFLIIRKGLLNSFIASFNGRDSDFKNWFSVLNNLNQLPVIVGSLLASIIAIKDFPQVEMTAKLSKNTKLELQFIYIGRILGETYFKSNNNKTDDVHRDWLMNLNPEKQINIAGIPEKFIDDAAIIIGYILALKFSMSNKQSMTIVRNFLDELTLSDDVINKKDEILFYTFFWLGTINQKLNTIFQTSITSDILLSIEKKSYQLSKNITVPFFDFFTDKFVLDWCKIKSENLRSSSKRFTEYCKMISGESPKERTEKQIIEKIAPYNLLSKKVLFFFFKDDSSLDRLWDMLQQLRFIEHVLLILKQYISPSEKDFNLENDILLNSIKKQFAKNYSKVNFEIITKNALDTDDRDIINNLKAYMHQNCTESNFVYLTDSRNERDSYRENLWLGTAFSSTPIFSKEENYLFIK